MVGADRKADHSLSRINAASGEMLFPRPWMNHRLWELARRGAPLLRLDVEGDSAFASGTGRLHVDLASSAQHSWYGTPPPEFGFKVLYTLAADLLGCHGGYLWVIRSRAGDRRLRSLVWWAGVAWRWRGLAGVEVLASIQFARGVVRALGRWRLAFRRWCLHGRRCQGLPWLRRRPPMVEGQTYLFS